MDTNLEEVSVKLEDVPETRVLLVDRPKKLKSRSNFHLWSVRFDDGANNRNVNILGADIVRRGHHSNVNV
jgi:hypothetical protein